MKKLILLVSILGFAGVANAMSLEDRVTELEINDSLNVWKFSGRLTNFYDNVKIDDGTTDYQRDQLRSLLWFDMEARPTDKLAFYGRMSYAKYWNTLTRRFREKEVGATRASFGYDSVGDVQRKYTTLDGVQFDKAYGEYKFTENFSFAIGRLPTSEGPPTNYYYGEGRMATYPRLAYNSFLDGIGLNYNRGNMSYRFLYTPFNYIADVGTFGSAANGSQMELGGTKDVSGVHGLYTFMAEYNNSKLGWADNVNAMFLYIDSYIPIGDFESSGILSDAVYLLKNYILHFEANNIARTGIHAALTVAVTGTGSEGAFYGDAVAFGGDGNGTFDGTEPAIGGVFTNDTESDEVSGNGILLALAYDIKGNNRVGIEYLVSGENYNYFDNAKDNLDDFYSIPGSGYHVYYVHNVGEGFNVTLGYKHSEQEYNRFWDAPLGERTELAEKVVRDNAYLLTSMSF